MAQRTGIGPLGAFILGAGVMYFADPNLGRRRRALLRDKSIRLVHQSQDILSKASRDMTYRVRGLVAESQSLLASESGAPDHVVEARIRSRLGRVVSHPHAIQVKCDAGRAVISGPIFEDEVRRLMVSVRHVHGIRDIEYRLESHRRDDVVPALQGGTRRGGSRPGILEDNWSPGMRLLAGCVGGMLLLRPGASLLRRLLGVGLLAPSVTSIEQRRLGAHPAIDIQKTITIHAPVETVFEFWRQFENFPRIMSHVQQVKDLGYGRSHWTVRGPAGFPTEWTAVVTRMTPNQLIAWKTEPGAAVEHAGSVHFQPGPDGTTRLSVRITYHPVAGTLGHILASLFGADPKSAMDDDLVRFKSLIEQGKTSGYLGHVKAEEVAHHE